MSQIFQIMSQGTVPQYSCPYKEATSQQSEMLKAAEMGGATPKLWKPRGVSYWVEMPKIVKIYQTGINSLWKLAMINGTPYIHLWGCLFIPGWSDVSIQLWNSNLVSSYISKRIASPSETFSSAAHVEIWALGFADGFTKNGFPLKLMLSQEEKQPQSTPLVHGVSYNFRYLEFQLHRISWNFIHRLCRCGSKG